MAAAVAAASMGPGTRRALAAAADLPDAGAGAVANPVRRCVALGPNGVINPGSSQDYDNNRALLLDSGTAWVRLWADWPSLQPSASALPGGANATRLAALDRQIAQARADGIRVILTNWRFPRWANGTAALSASQEATYQLPDRSPEGDSSRRKALEFKLPADLSPTGSWGRWIAFLAGRYGDQVEFIEIGNEPNLQLWPLQGPSATADAYDPGPLTVQLALATMFETAQAVAGDVGLLGPSTADRVDTGSRLGCGYDVFTSALLDELEARGFSGGPGFGWAHHNYTDVELAQSGASNRAARVRSLLEGRWAGWPYGDTANPQVFITEGGARLARIASVYGTGDTRAKQAELVQGNWDRNYASADGTGIAMVSQYLFFTDPNFDDGLCDADGTRRPAYATWSGLPLLAEELPAPPPPAPAPREEPSAAPTGAPVTGAAPAEPQQPTPPVTDAAPPTLALSLRRQHLARVLGRGLVLTVRASEPCRVEIDVSLGGTRVGRKVHRLAAAGTARVRVPARVRARRALRRARHPRLAIVVTATDGAGNSRRVSRHFTPER
jgi:hypothetical protein